MVDQPTPEILESRVAVQLRGYVCLDADIFLRRMFLPPDIDEGKDTGLLGQFAVRTKYTLLVW